MAAVSKQSSSKAAATRDLKQRVLSCLNKLSDRDTHSEAATELESIAKSLTRDSIPSFVASITATDSSDKYLFRKQCLHLVSLLFEHHANSLSPHLSKLLSSVVRRLRDPDSYIRSICISATASIASHLTKPSFSSIVKPFVDALVTEQDLNSQIGSALCLSAAIDAAADPEQVYLRKLLPRLLKLLKCESFKAKAALLTLIGNVIAAGGAVNPLSVKNLVPYLVEFMSNNDWATRKAAVEALTMLAIVEKESISEIKASFLKTFEAKRYDRVKIVREAMKQMLEAWKEIPDSTDAVSGASESSSPKGASKITSACQFETSQKRVDILAKRSSLPDSSSGTVSRKRSSSNNNKMKSSSSIFCKPDHRKSTGWKIEIATNNTTSRKVVSENASVCRVERVLEKEENGKNDFTKSGVRRALFSKNSDEKIEKIGGVKAGSRVVPCFDENPKSIAAGSTNQEISSQHSESNELFSIRKQLVQIENQQSNLLDLLQKFIGSTQNGMHSLETRVHGLELALDGISYDLAVSTGRMSNTESSGATCFKLPGAEYLSSKFWRKRGRYSALWFSGGTNYVTSMDARTEKSGKTGKFKVANRISQLSGGSGIIVNPLAEIRCDIRGISEVSLNRSNTANDVV